VNKSSSIQSQVYYTRGDDAEELVVGYRPLVSSSTSGLVDGRRINNIRIYVIDLSSSETINVSGEFYIGVLCEDVSSSLNTYDTSSVSSISVTATLEGDSDSVIVPIENGSVGARIRIEIVVCSVKLMGVDM